MRGDEARVVDAFAAYLTAAGWSVAREVEFCDLLAEQDGRRLYVEAKGRTTSPGLDVDTMYGQLLRRMPFDDDTAARFAVAVPDTVLKAALRVQQRVRKTLRIDIYSVGEDGNVSGPH
jgi:hypothetical protein